MAALVLATAVCVGVVVRYRRARAEAEGYLPARPRVEVPSEVLTFGMRDASMGKSS